MQIQFNEIKPALLQLKKVEVPEYMKNRLYTGIPFFDECLGEGKENPGFIAGSVILLAADPGAGKSTLLRQMSALTDLEVVYNVCEEGFEQVKMAIERMQLSEAFNVSNYTNIDELFEVLTKNPHAIVIIDSLQNMYTDFDHKGNPLRGRPGSKAQVTTVTERIYAFAKQNLVTFFLICHSTKGGDFAGPQAVEHTVDVSLHIDVTEDKESGALFRTLKAEKNRFGQAFVDYHLTMTNMGLALGEGPAPQNTEAGKKKGRTNKTAVKKFAREVYGEGPDCQYGREEFIKLLMEASECEPHTAISYYYMLRRELAHMQPTKAGK